MYIIRNRLPYIEHQVGHPRLNLLAGFYHDCQIRRAWQSFSISLWTKSFSTANVHEEGVAQDMKGDTYSLFVHVWLRGSQSFQRSHLAF